MLVSKVTVSLSNGLFLTVILVTCVSCDNDVPLTAHTENRSADHNRPGCWFGKTFYRLETTWKPVLYPLGEMVCVLCICHPVVKNDKLLVEGNVECHNIKESCPDVTCSDPRTKPGKCCQTCDTEDTPTPNVRVRGLRHMTDKPHMDQGGARQKDFVGLLVGRSEILQEKTRAVGSARFTLLNNHLSYSIRLFRIQGAALLWFKETHGTILYEKDLSQINKHTICGTWSNLPSIYVNYLQEGRLYVIIATHKFPDGEISGPVQHHRALNKESLSAVLSPSKKDGSGALAMMSFHSDNSLSITLLHSGIAHKKKRSLINVVFFKKKKRVKVIPATILPQESEIIEIWKKPRKRDLKVLVRERLEVAIEMRNAEVMKGSVTHKQTCDVLQAILSPADVSGNVRLTKKTVSGINSINNMHKGVGAVALFTVTSKGKLEYKVQFSGNEVSVSKILILPMQRKKVKPVCIITVSGSTNSVDGSCGSVKAQTLQMLYQRRLNVKVMSRPQLTGSIKPLIYHEDSSTNGIHVLLTSSGLPSVSPLVGHAWLSVSRLCQVHYLIALDDRHLPDHHNWYPYIKDTNTGALELLEGVAGTMARGVTELTKEVLGNLKKGKSQLLITTNQYPDGEIGSRIRIDNECGSLLTGSDSGARVPDGGRTNRPRGSVDPVEAVNHCMVNDTKYLTNDVWIPFEAPCTTCNCEKGEVTCHPVACVVPACRNPVTVPNDCCPQCVEMPFSTGEKCFFDGDKRHHHVGTVFHPYVIPFGYQKCAVCSCSASDHEVVCARLPCPQLPCPHTAAIRAHPHDCCKTCPEGFEGADLTAPPPLSPQDINNMLKSCDVLGSRLPSGSVWKPQVGTLGTIPCITCQCLDGTRTCTKQKCPQLDCPESRQTKPQGGCCHVCQDAVNNGPNRRDKR